MKLSTKTLSLSYSINERSYQISFHKIYELHLVLTVHVNMLINMLKFFQIGHGLYFHKRLKLSGQF